MGFSPIEVDQMDVFQFMSCCEGFRASKSTDKEPADIDDAVLAEMGVVGFEQ